jgi:hypothetical protein
VSVRCVFTGKIDGAGWYGTVPPSPSRPGAGHRDIITGNDFTEACIGAGDGVARPLRPRRATVARWIHPADRRRGRAVLYDS